MSDYNKKERARYWPVAAELMAQYNDGSHTEKNSYGGLDWWQNGQHYRDGDNPAYIDSGGTLEWCQNNKLHRLCGPAAIFGPGVICPDGWLEWCINDKDITREVNAWLGSEEWQGTPEKIVEFKLRFI